jgi:hypothetical protein
MGVRRGATADEPLQVTADASGHFALELPRAGSWRLQAQARGFRDQDYDEHEGFYSAVVLTEAEPALSITFQLVPDSVIRGVALDETGDPVVAAQVWAELIPDPIPGVSATSDTERPRPTGFSVTNDLGQYEIGGLAPGNYHVRIQAQPWYASNVGRTLYRAPDQTNGGAAALDPPLDVVYPMTWFPGTADEESAQTIVLAPGEERQADFQLAPIPSIHLQIPAPEINQRPNSHRLGEPVPQRPATVTRIVSSGAGFQSQVQPSYNGTSWDFSGLSPGLYEVRIPGSDLRSEPEVKQIEVRAGSQQVITLEGARSLVPVTLKLDGAPDSDVEFIETATGQHVTSSPGFRGRRQWSSGDDEEDGPTSEPVTGARTVNLAAGQYEVYVSGGSGSYLTGITAQGAKAVGRTVNIGGPATLTLKTSNRHAQVEGVARIGDKPAAGAMVLLVPVTLGRADDLGAVERDETNTDGTFLIAGVTPGQYILVAIDHGWSVKWRDPATLAQYLVRGTPVDLRSASNAHEEIQAVSR